MVPRRAAVVLVGHNVALKSPLRFCPACLGFSLAFSRAPRCFFSLAILRRLSAAVAASCLTFLGLFFALHGGHYSLGDQLSGTAGTGVITEFSFAKIESVMSLPIIEKGNLHSSLFLLHNETHLHIRSTGNCSKNEEGSHETPWVHVHHLNVP